MHKPEQTIIEQLEEFEKDVSALYVTVPKMANLSKTEQRFAKDLYSGVCRKVGYLGGLVSELSGVETVNINGRSVNIWSTALALPLGKLNHQALGVSIQAIGRALGKLENEIKRGLRNEKTGKLIEKVDPIHSKPKEVADSRKIWQDIDEGFGINKNKFGRRINFISNAFTRKIIFRDIEQAYTLAKSGFYKPAVLLAGGVIEELLRLYLEFKNVKPSSETFDGYIQACISARLLKKGISQLSHSVRGFRNLVHLSKEESKKYTISKSTAIGAVSAIFTITNDF